MRNETYEAIYTDSIEKPIDIIFGRNVNYDLPFYVRSTGYYNEGKRFNCFHYGFDNYCIFVTLGGEGMVKYRNTEVKLKRGDVIFTSNNEATYFKSLNESWHFCFFNIAGISCGEYERIWNNDSFSVIHSNDTSFYESSLGIINDLISRPYLKSELEICLCITQILTHALCEREKADKGTTDDKYPKWIKDASDYISENCEKNIKISDIASMFYMSKAYFSRSFKKITGKSPKEYQICCRLETCAMLLRTTDLNIMDIAQKTGFESQSFFCKLFKRTYGVTPGEYRKFGAKKD